MEQTRQTAPGGEGQPGRAPRRPRKKRRVRPVTVGVLALLALAVFSGTQVAHILLSNARQAADFARLKQRAQGEGEQGAGPDYAALQAQNPDFIAWLHIEGTGVDYPVMHTPDRPSYYLRRNFEGGYASNGVPFLAEGCDIGASDNLIVYGHAIRGYRMFGELFYYKKEDYWREHPNIELDTADEHRIYRVVAALNTTVNAPEGDPYPYYDFFTAADAQEYDAYVETAKQLAFYDTGVAAEYGEQLLTLSTCEYRNAATERFLVVAKLIESEPRQSGEG